jgi:hypothetical protein
MNLTLNSSEIVRACLPTVAQRRLRPGRATEKVYPAMIEAGQASEL